MNGHCRINSGGLQVLGYSGKVFYHSLLTKSDHSGKRFRHTFLVCRIDIAVNTNSGFNGLCTDIPFLYQQFDLRQNRLLRGVQLIVDFEAADRGLPYVTTRKTKNFQDDKVSVQIDNFKDHNLLLRSVFLARCY